MISSSKQGPSIRRPRSCGGILAAVILGLISYVVIFISLRLGGDGPLLTGYALTLIAVAFSLYLTYREVFTIRAICSWCVSSAVVFTLLAIVGSRRALHSNYAGAGPAPA